MKRLMKQAAKSGLTKIVTLSALTVLASAAAQAATVRSFEGTSQLDNCLLGQCFRPPDTMGAVGTTQFLETTNGSITVYDKSNGAVQSRLNMVNFWANAGLPGGAFGDQRVLFDHYTNRWIMSGFGADVKDINIAISDTSNALGPWKSTQFQGVAPGGTADYPTLAMDDKGVYIGTNNFNNGFKGTSLFVIPKASLFGGAPSTVGMTTFNTPLAGPDNGFAIQAAVNWGGNATNTASVMADSRDANAQVFYKVNNVTGPATQTAAAIIAGSGYNVAGAGRQPDGSRVVDTLGPRISANVVQANGRLFSVATVRADVGDFAAVRWSVNDANTGALISTGKISGGNYDYYEGSIAVNEFGDVVIGYNRSGAQTADLNGDGKADGRVSFLAQAFDVNGAGSLVLNGAANLLRVSDVSDYHCGDRFNNQIACRERWGDYSAVTIDPTNHHKFWAIGEYAADWAFLPPPNQGLNRAIWHTYISEIDVSAPIPEPETYALMLAGLAAVGWVSRRRARAAA